MGTRDHLYKVPRWAGVFEAAECVPGALSKLGAKEPPAKLESETGVTPPEHKPESETGVKPPEHVCSTELGYTGLSHCLLILR